MILIQYIGEETAGKWAEDKAEEVLLSTEAGQIPGPHHF